MIFRPTPLRGAYVVELQELHDERGFFARSYCEREFAAHGLTARIAQCNLSFNHRAGTLRGLHYQLPPAGEAKFIRCVRGSVFDVIVDLRSESETFLQHFAVELSQDNRLALYVPEMFGHGFQTLRDDTEVIYQVSEFYTPGQERGIRFDDPTFGIEWPRPATVVSSKDLSWPPYRPGEATA